MCIYIYIYIYISDDGTRKPPWCRPVRHVRPADAELEEGFNPSIRYINPSINPSILIHLLIHLAATQRDPTPRSQI